MAAAKALNARTPEALLQEAERIAAHAGILIVAKRNASGGVSTWKVYRKTTPHLTFLGERVNAEGVLALVRASARSTATR